MNVENRRLVAGVSSFDTRPQLIRWAVDETAARGAELRLVTAVPQRAASERYLPSDAADELRRDAHDTLAQAAKYAEQHRPGLWITTEVVGGRPADVLLAAATHADLLVVGADDQSPFTEAIIGSVPGTLLTTAPCPLVVVPHSDLNIRADMPVVVALDESGTSQAAMAYAFATADRTRRPLRVLHCVLDGHDDGSILPGLARALTGFGALYPRVDAAHDVVAGDPRDVLTQRSRTSALLVLGSRGHGRLASGLFGSVGRTLIRRSGCPVVIARPRSAELTRGMS
ncbi:universal stress protein [Actinophytocola sp.]|uniref:universal stress protein n=1 Tax=Actinophytocola sp. TaxID=1872138 RepID=UPI0025B7EA86|nr:universal stress protein [Actinophytocola sp.]